MVNKEAMKEVELMGKSVLQCQHPLAKVSQPIICLYMRSWKKHIQHFVNDEVYSLYSSVFCFTENHLKKRDEIKVYLLLTAINDPITELTY